MRRQYAIEWRLSLCIQRASKLSCIDVKCGRLQLGKVLVATSASMLRMPL